MIEIRIRLNRKTFDGFWETFAGVLLSKVILLPLCISWEGLEVETND